MNRVILRQLRACQMGDLLCLRWYDASEESCTLGEHSAPEIVVAEYGVFLGIEGNPRHVLIGKFYVPKDRKWHATRIPLSSIHSFEVIAKKSVKDTWLRRYYVTEYKRNNLEVRYRNCLI